MHVQSSRYPTDGTLLEPCKHCGNKPHLQRVVVTDTSQPSREVYYVMECPNPDCGSATEDFRCDRDESYARTEAIEQWNKDNKQLGG